MEKFRCGHDKSPENTRPVNKSNSKAGVCCVVCRRARARKIYSADSPKREMHRQKQKLYAQLNAKKINAYIREWHAKNPEKNKEYRRLSKYSLTPEQFQLMFDKYEGCCYICGIKPEPLSNGNSGLQIDHDHSCCFGAGRTCGKCIRGLLCFSCNRMLGSLEKKNIKRVLDYLGYDPTKGGN